MISCFSARKSTGDWAISDVENARASLSGSQLHLDTLETALAIASHIKNALTRPSANSCQPAANGQQHGKLDMNQWLNDTNFIANGHATLGPTLDVPMSFPQQPQTINPAQFQNKAYLNGRTRTASPAFPQPMYQTNSIIPSKRSREDSLGTSPRQAHNAPPGSRAQTPGQGSYPGYNPQPNGAPSFTSAPTPFQHLQTSNNATPSPTMQSMGFAPPSSAAQRVNTASPNPFSPQHNMTGASPAPSDHASRVGTPHDIPPNFMVNPSMNPAFNGQQMAQSMAPQALAQQLSMGGQMPQGGMMNPAQRYQLQLQAQARQMQIQQQQGRVANGMSAGPQTNMQQMALHDQQNAPPTRISNTPQDFFRGLQQFSAAKGRPLDPTPHIYGRPVQAFQIYQAVFKQGGSARVTKEGRWPVIATMLQFMPQQVAQAAMEIQQWWMVNVGTYEQMWIHQQHRQRLVAQSQMQNQMSPGRDGPQPSNHQRSQSDLAQVKINGQPPSIDRSSMNGFTPTKDQNEVLANHQRSSSRSLDAAELNGMLPQSPQEQQQKRPTSASIKAEAEVEPTMPARKPITDPFVPEVMSPGRNHGPINVDEVFGLGQHIVELKPVVPNIRELGLIDIHALTMSIKSGMHGETRNALDTLITISSEPSLQLQLDMCDDLVETLVDCAQVEVDFLAEHASEVSDEVSLSSYEELGRACHAEARVLQPVPAFGSLEYDLDRAADRLICITTLIRNLSFYEPNFVTLGQPEVVQLVARIIQHIGTKDLPLRTARNTLDFMKDIIIYLSNLSSSLHLPGKQDALCLLHFLLAFAPSPPPMHPNSDKIAFTSYNPNIHKYLPPAVDSLAKLLARDEPNRIYFKSIFVADGHAAVPYELLTRTFGLVVAPIPHASASLRAQVEARKPFLLQGMLAAEILASLAPGSEHPLARSWLQSEDCFAGNLLKMASLLSGQPTPSKQSNSRNLAPLRASAQDDDPLAHGSIVNRAMALLKTLANKSRTVDLEGNVSAAGVPGNAMMKRETLLGVMIQKEIDDNMLKQFCQYAGLEE